MKPLFSEGILYFGAAWPNEEILGRTPVLLGKSGSLENLDDPQVAFQALLLADALRYLALQMCASKESGHVGGFSSAAEVYAALFMLGQKNIVLDVGHHVPGLYSALFLDGSLDLLNITNVRELCAAFRESGGLTGHPSVAIPGIIAPSGPLGQGQHFAMGAALRFPDVCIPLLVGDGGLDEPFVLTALLQYSVVFPERTNVLPIFVWNGYSQEHYSHVSNFSNDQIELLLRSHGLGQIEIIDASEFENPHIQSTAFVDSTQFSLGNRLMLQQCIIRKLHSAIRKSLSGTRNAIVIKQIKGAGMHEAGANSHNLLPGDNLQNPKIRRSLQQLAISAEAWSTIRQNLLSSGNGPAAKSAVYSKSISVDNPNMELNFQDKVGCLVSSSTSVADSILKLDGANSDLLITSSDAHFAMGMGALNKSLFIKHPTASGDYYQNSEGRIFSPVNEDACAGLASAFAFFGGRSIWTSYESFAVNGVSVMQTASQALAETRKARGSIIALFSALTLEQNRNGWTHQRPEIESYLCEMIKSGNVYVLYPGDANMSRVCYEWARQTNNKCIVLICSRTPLPIRFTQVQSAAALHTGAIVASDPLSHQVDVTLVSAGDMALNIAMDSRDKLLGEGINARVVAVVNPRRLYTPSDVDWSKPISSDASFMDDASFSSLFDAKIVVGISTGSSAPLTPVMLRVNAEKKGIISWQRGYTTADSEELAKMGRLGSTAVINKVKSLI